MNESALPAQVELDEAARAAACPTPPIDAVEDTLRTLSTVPRLPAFARTRNVKEQFQHAFELIGGIPRLAMWAHENPTQFYALYSKLIPQSINQKLDGTLKVELSWVNGRDTSGRSASANAIIDVEASK